MSSFRIRPRFKHMVKEPLSGLEERLREKINQSDSFNHSYSPGHIVIKVKPEDRHYWSPQLSISLEENPENKQIETIIRGLYGPNPTVWAVFFFGYATLAISALFAGMVGFSQLMLGHDSWLLWIVPVCAVLALILYFVAQTGQKIGAQQMYDLHHFYEEQIKERVEIS